MKLCPNCKAEMDDNARFCLCCMTSLDEKELISPSVRKKRRWPLVLLCVLLLGIGSVLAVFLINYEPQEPKTPPDSSSNSATADTEQSSATMSSATMSSATMPSVEDASLRTCVVDGVTYTFRPATEEEHPTAIALNNNYVLIRVEGSSPSGFYQVPSFVGNDTTALVTVVADGAFDGTDAQGIDLGYNVRYVWGNAFGGNSLTELHLHEDVFIDEMAFSCCTEELTIHCPEYLDNTEGTLWCELAVSLGFRWQQEII